MYSTKFKTKYIEIKVGPTGTLKLSSHARVGIITIQQRIFFVIWGWPPTSNSGPKTSDNGFPNIILLIGFGRLLILGDSETQATKLFILGGTWRI